MRDYIQTYWQSFDIYDDTVPPPVLTGTLTHVSADAEQAAAFAATLPSSGPTFYVPQDAGFPVWVLINKAAIITALNSAAPFQNSANIQFSSPRYGVGGTKEEPKYAGWPSNDGDPRNPTYNKHLGDVKRFSFTTYNAVVDAITKLLLLWKALGEAGFKAEADRLEQYIIELKTKGYVADPVAFQKFLDHLGVLLA